MRLNRANTAIMRMVNVPAFKSRPFPGEPTGSQGGKATFMSKLRQGIGLIHKLRKLTGPKKFLNRRNHRSNINQSLRGYDIHILDGHTLPDHSFHTGKSNADLIL